MKFELLLDDVRPTE